MRSKGGIPTITADDYKGLGFGYGYALAYDNICTIAEAYVTANAERSRYFGADADSPEGYTNLETDFFYAADQGRAGSSRSSPRRRRPQARSPRSSRRSTATSRATTATSTRPGSTTSPIRPAPAPPGCARSPRWTPTGASTSSASSRSGQIAEDGIANAAPPAAPRAAAPAADGCRRRRARRGARRAPQRLGLQRLGPRRRGDRRTAAAWCSPTRTSPGAARERFYQSHLRIPGELNVSGRQPLRRPGDQHRPHREPGLDPHGLDRLPVHPDRAHPGARRPDQLPGRRPAGADGVERGHGADVAARRLARPGDPDAVHDPVRAGVQHAPGPVAVRLDRHHRLRDVRRQRREHRACSTTSSTPTTRSRPRSCSRS